MPADTATADAFAAGQREADRVALVAALGMDPSTTWEEALEHAGGRYASPAGWEAEELRHAMERYTDGPVADEMQIILDSVDARDSLRWLEETDAAHEKGRRAGREEAANTAFDAVFRGHTTSEEAMRVLNTALAAIRALATPARESEPARVDDVEGDL